MGYAVIIVHHSGKSRGASIIEVPMDFVLKLSEPSDKVLSKGACFDFEITKEDVILKMIKVMPKT